MSDFIYTLSEVFAMKLARLHFLVTGLVWSVLAGILLFVGCERKPHIGRACASWRTTSARRRVHGIDDGSAYSGRYREGTAIIVWTDILACSFPIEATWDKTSNCAKYAGYLKSPRGLKINVECYVAERMKGSMTINQQEYDLANGSLFLISFRSPQIRVGQINQDIYAITSIAEARRQLVENVPEIRTFFEAAANE